MATTHRQRWLRRALARWFAVGLLAIVPAGVSAGDSGLPMPAVELRLAQAGTPQIVSISPTRNGITIRGSGFGRDRSRVRVLVNGRPLPSFAVTSMSDQRISVRTGLSGSMRLSVTVGSTSSAVSSFVPTPSGTARATTTAELRRRHGDVPSMMETPRIVQRPAPQDRRKSGPPATFAPRAATTPPIAMTGLRKAPAPAASQPSETAGAGAAADFTLTVPVDLQNIMPEGSDGATHQARVFCHVEALGAPLGAWHGAAPVPVSAATGSYSGNVTVNFSLPPDADLGQVAAVSDFHYLCRLLFGTTAADLPGAPAHSRAKPGTRSTVSVSGDF